MTEAGLVQISEATAVITVRTGIAFNTQLQDACEQRGWVAQFSDYQSYLSRERRAALSTLRAVSACVVFINFDGDVAQAVETVAYLSDALSSQFSLVAVAQQMAPVVVLAAMRAGCKEFLSLDGGPSALFDILEHLETRTEMTPRTNIREASVFSFFGTKGGVGTTSIAVNLANGIRQVSNKRVLLIDHHAELGDVCLYMGLDGSRAQLSECVRSVGRLDSELLRGFVVRHASGIEVLSSPDTCQASRPLDPEAVGRTLEFLRTEYDYVILDCADAAAEESEAILAVSTSVYLVTTPEVSALRNLSRLIETLTPMDCCREKLQIVMNRSSSPEALSAAQIESAMKLAVSVQFPFEPAEMVPACNLGKPLAQIKGAALFGHFIKWASSLTGVPLKAAAPKKTRPMLSLFQPSRQPAAGRS